MIYYAKKETIVSNGAQKAISDLQDSMTNNEFQVMATKKGFKYTTVGYRVYTKDKELGDKLLGVGFRRPPAKNMVFRIKTKTIVVFGFNTQGELVLSKRYKRPFMWAYTCSQEISKEFGISVWVINDRKYK